MGRAAVILGVRTVLLGHATDIRSAGGWAEMLREGRAGRGLVCAVTGARPRFGAGLARAGGVAPFWTESRRGERKAERKGNGGSTKRRRSPWILSLLWLMAGPGSCA